MGERARLDSSAGKDPNGTKKKGCVTVEEGETDVKHPLRGLGEMAPVWERGNPTWRTRRRVRSKPRCGASPWTQDGRVLCPRKRREIKGDATFRRAIRNQTECIHACGCRRWSKRRQSLRLFMGRRPIGTRCLPLPLVCPWCLRSTELDRSIPSSAHACLPPPFAPFNGPRVATAPPLTTAKEPMSSKSFFLVVLGERESQFIISNALPCVPVPLLIR